MNFSNLKIGTRLGAGFALVLALLVLVAGVGIGRLSDLNDNVVDLAENRLPKLLVSNQWIFSMLQTARQTRNMLILDDKDKVKAEIDGVMKWKAKRREYMEQLQASIVSPEGKAILQKVVDARATYTPYEDEFLKLVAAGDMASAKTVLLDKARPTQLVYIDAISKLVDFQAEQVKHASADAREDYRQGRNVMLALLAGALLAGAAYSLFVTRSITRPMGRAVAIAETVASGDLTSRIEASSTDETGQLLHALKAMNDNLVNIVGQVHQGTATIASASSQIASGNQDLSSRTEEQASSLEETASSMEEN
jgi:methyl-accepting chemotaxis protein